MIKRLGLVFCSAYQIVPRSQWTWNLVSFTEARTHLSAWNPVQCFNSTTDGFGVFSLVNFSIRLIQSTTITRSVCWTLVTGLLNCYLGQTGRFYFKKPSEPADSSGKNIVHLYTGDVMERKQFGFLTVVSVRLSQDRHLCLMNLFFFLSNQPGSMGSTCSSLQKVLRTERYVFTVTCSNYPLLIQQMKYETSEVFAHFPAQTLGRTKFFTVGTAHLPGFQLQLKVPSF